MSWPYPNSATGSCLTNLLARHEVVLDQCPCWCHNGYSPPCYDCAEVVCYKKTYDLPSQNMAPSAPPFTHDPVVPGLVGNILDNRSANNNNSDDININNNEWPSASENSDPVQGHLYGSGAPRPRHLRSSGLAPSPLGSRRAEGGSSSMNNNVTTVGSTWSSSRNRPGSINNINRPGSISSFSDIARWYSNNKPRKRSRPVSMNRTGSPSSTDRAGSMNLLESAMGWQGSSHLSNVSLPTAVGTTAPDTVSPDAAKWPVSRCTVYPEPERDATTFQRLDSGNVNSSTDADDFESTVPNLSTNSGSISGSEQNLSSSPRFQPFAISSDSEMVIGIVGTPSSSTGDVDAERAEEENSVFSSEDRGRRLIEETLYPTEISGRTKPFLLWKLNL